MPTIHLTQDDIEGLIQDAYGDGSVDWLSAAPTEAVLTTYPVVFTAPAGFQLQRADSERAGADDDGRARNARTYKNRNGRRDRNYRR
jgi:hypothetical protein